jgi:hypothetical protein
MVVEHIPDFSNAYNQGLYMASRTSKNDRRILQATTPKLLKNHKAYSKIVKWAASRKILLSKYIRNFLADFSNS